MSEAVALTVKQPWASLIITGAKDIENREWHSSYRGIVCIHSSAMMFSSDMEDACDFMREFDPKFSADYFQKCHFPTGVILGTVEMVGCTTRSESPWFIGKYGFVLTDAVAFPKPIPCKGALGFWKVPDHLAVTLREQYASARSGSLSHHA